MTFINITEMRMLLRNHLQKGHLKQKGNLSKTRIKHLKKAHLPEYLSLQGLERMVSDPQPRFTEVGCFSQFGYRIKGFPTYLHQTIKIVIIILNLTETNA